MLTIERAAMEAGVPVSVIRGPNRRRDLCMIRWAVMLTLRERGLSYPTIGRIVNRNHGTVITGVRQARNYREQYPAFTQFMEAIAQQGNVL